MAVTAHLGRLRRQSLLSLGGAVAGSAAGFGLVLAATRGLSTDEAGAALLAIALFSIASRVGQLGTGTAIVHFMTARYSARPDRALPALLRTAVPAVIVASLALSGLLVITAEPLASLVEDDGPGTGLASAIRWSALFVPVGAMVQLLLDATRGYAVVGPTLAIGRVGRPVVQLAAVVAVAAAGGGSVALAVAWIAPAVPAVVAAAIWLRQLHRPSTLPQPDVRRDFWNQAIPQTGVDSIRTLVRWQDGIVVGILLGAGPAAVYVAVTRLVKVASLVNTAFSETVAPHVGEAFGSDDPERASTLYRTSTWWLILLLGPVYLATAVHAEVLTSIFGSEYTHAASVLVILALGKFAGTIVGSVESVLIVSGNAGVNLGNHAASMVTNIVLNIALVPWIGLDGAALAWVASILITNYGPFVQLRSRTGLSPFDRTTALVIGAVAVAVVGPAVLTGAIASTSVVATALSIALATAIIAAGVWKWRHHLHLDRMPAAPAATVGVAS